ncbi:uncharacterized protein LOC113872614 [Abrus precatorius]|uniref:Uncharacterized protein LOC113872614 n=1 Tax=Abrus precatorius TaxID=3816 RepID=A0A8B8ME73_ABRPR|nr:uncharacterized protein LOC113872614 [Abrus precatorius]
MLRQNGSMDLNLIPGKIRKRGCSWSALTFSCVPNNNYKFKRAVLVGKRGGSDTPVPTWKFMSSRSPLRGCKEKQAPVSARKLAATLWEMNEKERCVEAMLKKEYKAKERLARFMHSGSMPPHLSDPSHSPLSERMDRSGTGCCHRRTPSISNMLKPTHQHVVPLDSLSNASLMEIETRSRTQTPDSSIIGVKIRLKDISNALTTSKELLKIIKRIWGHEDRPSSSLSLISALHTELERGRMQVNQLIKEQHLDQNEISYLMKCFAEEKAAWKSKEQEIVEAAIESVAGELDVERKLRRRFESLNKKLGRELAETKASLLKMVKKLEIEKRAREIIEQVYDELARHTDEDKYETEKIERESTKVYDEVQKKKEMMQLADILCEERAQMKLSEAKYQLEEKNAVVKELRNQLETFLGNKKDREKGCSTNNLNDQEISAHLGRTGFVSHNNKGQEDDGEVDNGVEYDDSAESDLHPIELNMEGYDDSDNNMESHKWAHLSDSRFNIRKYAIKDENKRRRSTSGVVSRRSTSLQRSALDGIEWGIQVEKVQNSKDGLDWESLCEIEKQAHGKGYGNEPKGYKSVKGLRDQLLAGSRLGSSIVYASPTRQYSQSCTSHLSNTFQERPAKGQGNGIKSRLVDLRGAGKSVS